MESWLDSTRGDVEITRSESQTSGSPGRSSAASFIVKIKSYPQEIHQESVLLSSTGEKRPEGGIKII